MPAHGQTIQQMPSNEFLPDSAQKISDRHSKVNEETSSAGDKSLGDIAEQLKNQIAQFHDGLTGELAGIEPTELDSATLKHFLNEQSTPVDGP